MEGGGIKFHRNLSTDISNKLRKGEGGVKNWVTFADVLNGWSLMKYPNLTLKVVCPHMTKLVALMHLGLRRSDRSTFAGPLNAAIS